MFEMVAGYNPFVRGNWGDAMAICESVLESSVTFDARHFVGASGDAARDLVQLLLEPAVLDRLGCGPGGVSLLKEHAWFAVDGPVNWQALLAKSVRAPSVPPADIMSNFVQYESSDDDERAAAELNAPLDPHAADVAHRGPGEGDEWCAGF